MDVVRIGEYHPPGAEEANFISVINNTRLSD